MTAINLLWSSHLTSVLLLIPRCSLDFARPFIQTKVSETKLWFSHSRLCVTDHFVYLDTRPVVQSLVPLTTFPKESLLYSLFVASIYDVFSNDGLRQYIYAADLIFDFDFGSSPVSLS